MAYIDQEGNIRNSISEEMILTKEQYEKYQVKRECICKQIPHRIYCPLGFENYFIKKLTPKDK